MVKEMSGGITDKIQFRMLSNTAKYYWKDHESDIDYPRTFIGTMTPTRFLWTKKEHLLNVMEQAITNKDDKIIKVGNRMITPREFIMEIYGTSMWTFDME
jgi:hypothetical protein